MKTKKCKFCPNIMSVTIVWDHCGCQDDVVIVSAKAYKAQMKALDTGDYKTKICKNCDAKFIDFPPLNGSQYIPTAYCNPCGKKPGEFNSFKDVLRSIPKHNKPEYLDQFKKPESIVKPEKQGFFRSLFKGGSQ